MTPVKKLTLLSVLGLFVGCQALATKNADEPVGAVVKPASQPATKPAKPRLREPRVVDTIDRRLLRQAELAFRSGNYFSPSHNNAYDKFHSVLLINSDSTQARAGLQAILLRYSQSIRSALQDGHLTTATNRLSQVEPYFPANALLLDLKKQIRKARAAVATESRLVPTEPAAEYEEMQLSVSDLNARAASLQSALALVGQRLKSSNESVMIVARSDREGRWIYKQLKSAVTGYRIRGDIQIGRSPKLRFLPPL